MDKTIMKLEAILDYLCKMTGRDIAIFYPTKQSEIVPYLKKEIKTTLELVK
jgi:ABC-type phosphate/phosphonate transport system substrate-binding protein|tara:strand:- start:219 stop:371 length:153 start_codon:yes stop_codon:yes gene_type:complete